MRMVAVELEWPDNFYDEYDPKKRLKILDKAEKEHPEQAEDNVIRRKIFEKRYDFSGKMIVDNYLMFWNSSNFHLQNLEARFFRDRVVAREKKIVLDELLQSGMYAPEAPDREQQLLRDELMQTMRLYLYTCTTGNYGSVAMGIGHLKDEKLINRIATDLVRYSIVLPKKLGIEKEYEVIRQVAAEAFAEKYPDTDAYEDHVDLLNGAAK